MVSVIIPTYKGEDKILMTIASVLKQTYKDIEIIVVDDNGKGSENQLSTENALQKLISKKIIKYIVHEKNINGSAARNTGFFNSVGEYINFLDDDDYLLPTKIERQVALLKNSSEEIGAVVCGTYFVHEDGKGFTRIPQITDNFKVDYLTEKTQFNTSAILFKRSSVTHFNGFDETFRRHQDWEFCFRVMSKYKFCSCNELLLIKYATNRNVAYNPQVAAKYYCHFKEKMQPYFALLNMNEKNTILNYQVRRIFKCFILSYDPLNAFKYAKQENMNIIQIFKAFWELFLFALKKITIPKKKITKSIDEILNEAIYFVNKYQK